MKRLYFLEPSLHANLWGGNKLRGYGKESAEDRIGESWELSFVKGAEAKADGICMGEIFPKELWGKRAERFEFFPVLTKFIDAREKLSVQVHPDDEYALKNEGMYGKSEMWYVVEADEGAGLYMGTSRNVTAEEFAEAVKGGTVEDILSFKEVKAGDVFFIPAGTIHAIGEGVLIFEIQQNSTLTYRLYDYMRRDKMGNLRELHVDKAMKVLRAEVYEPIIPNTEGDLHPDALIGECEYFKTHEYKLAEGEVSLTVGEESFLAVTAVSGECEIVCPEGRFNLSLGRTAFIPAGEDFRVTLSGSGTVITVEV
jgi:mannose-6-phosphate isomerase class I